MQSLVYVGIKGRVTALDRTTGTELWTTPLNGGDFVNVLVDVDRIFASTRGEVFCLDATSGRLLWANKMPGCGFGVAALATPRGASDLSVLEASKRQEAARDAG